MLTVISRPGAATETAPAISSGETLGRPSTFSVMWMPWQYLEISLMRAMILCTALESAETFGGLTSYLITPVPPTRPDKTFEEGPPGAPVDPRAVPVLPVGTSRLPPGSPSAVLVALYGEAPRVLMIVKSGKLRRHAGEVAFPGGRAEPQDADLLETALRETREELGLEVERARVRGELAPVRTLGSNFAVMPFVAALDRLPQLSPSGEVDRVLRIPLGPLLETADPERGTFEFGGRVIWGASARILQQLAGGARA